MSRRTTGLAVSLITTVHLLTACSGSSGRTAPAVAATAATRGATSAPPTSPVETAALNAYRDFWTAYVEAGDPMNPDDPRLAAHATGDELARVQQTFSAYKAAGNVIRGDTDLAPKVVEAAVDHAQVRDCYDDRTGLYAVTTGIRQDQEDPRRHLVTATLVVEQGVWKVSAVKHEGDGCTAA